MRSAVPFVLFASLLAVTACNSSRTESVAPADTLKVTNAGSTLAGPRGNITGFVTLHDEFGSPKPDNAGMVVSLEGLLTAFPATTRPEGRFTINNAFAGTYNLSYGKKGYGNFKRIGVGHAGGTSPTTAESVALWETAQTVTSELSVQVTGLALTFSGLASPVQPANVDAMQRRRVRLFFGRDERVTALNYVSTFNQTIVPPGGTGFTVKLSADELLAFRPGERVYVVAHGITATENAYVDPDTKRRVYSGINPVPSNVVSFVLP